MSVGKQRQAMLVLKMWSLVAMLVLDDWAAVARAPGEKLHVFCDIPASARSSTLAAAPSARIGMIIKGAHARSRRVLSKENPGKNRPR